MCRGQNPLLSWQDLPPFDRFRVEDFKPAVLRDLERGSALFEQLEQSQDLSPEELLDRLEQLSLCLERSWELGRHLNTVASSDALLEAICELEPLVQDHHTRLQQSRPIFDQLQGIREDPAIWGELTRAQQRVIEIRLRDAQQSGVSLPPAQQEEFARNAKRLAQLSTQFSNQVLEATKAWSLTIEDAAELEGVPLSVRRMAASRARKDGHEEASAESGPWTLTLSRPCFQGVLSHARSRSLRRRIYEAFATRASSGEWDNRPLVEEILALRQAQAELLGAASWAELSLQRKMAPGVREVEAMLLELSQACDAPLEADLRDLYALAASAGAEEAERLEAWDLSFWMERRRETSLGLNEEELRPYFAFPQVLEALFEQVEELFGVRISSADGEASVWHEDVRFFRVFDEQDQLLGSLFLDPYSRPENKRGGAWVRGCLSRSRVDAAEDQPVRLPVAYVHCNQTPPAEGLPSLMTHREIRTLFHEFGHALHHVLTTVDCSLVAGIRGVEWDAVELPSQFMENWCYHPPLLQRLARHVETGEPLPAEQLDRIQRARSFGSAILTRRQLVFGLTDLALHHDYRASEGDSALEIYHQQARAHGALPPWGGDHFLCAFGHIFAGGYSAGYYSYKWAEILSCDAFEAFREVGLDRPETRRAQGRRFLREILSQGGSEHPEVLYRRFRGRDPSLDALLRTHGLTAETH